MSVEMMVLWQALQVKSLGLEICSNRVCSTSKGINCSGRWSPSPQKPRDKKLALLE